MQSVDTEAESYFLWKCCRKGDPFQGPKPGSCLTLGNELSEETHLLTEQEILLGKGARVESRRVREPRRTAPPWLTVSGCMVMGLVSGSSLANPSDPVLPGGARLVQPRWMPERRILGRSDMWCLPLAFPELFRLVVAYYFRVPYQDLLS